MMVLLNVDWIWATPKPISFLAFFFFTFVLGFVVAMERSLLLFMSL
jgi:hypothetical protein